jgi:hypothetical protein
VYRTYETGSPPRWLYAYPLAEDARSAILISDTIVRAILVGHALISAASITVVIIVIIVIVIIIVTEPVIVP